MDENKYQIYATNLLVMFDKVKRNISKKHKYYNELLQFCKELPERIRQDKGKEVNSDKYLVYMRMALDCDTIKILESVMEHMQKLIQSELLEGNIIEEVKEGTNTEGKNKQRKMIDGLIDTFVQLFNLSDENINLNIIKILYLLYCNSKVKIHSSSLLKVFKICIHIFHSSRSQVNNDSAKATLIQMIQLLWQRMEMQNSQNFSYKDPSAKCTTEIEESRFSTPYRSELNNNNLFRALIPRNPLEDALIKIVRNVVDDVCLYNSKLGMLQHTLQSEQQSIIQTQNLTDFSKITIELNEKMNLEASKLSLRSVPAKVEETFTKAQYRTTCNPNIENEKGFISGSFGWCTYCRQKADFYCKDLRLPICSFVCKGKLLEDFTKTEKYLNSEYYEEEPSTLLLNDSISIFRSLCKLVNTSISTNHEQNNKIKLLGFELIAICFEKSSSTFQSNKEFVKLVKEELIDCLLKTCLSEDTSLFTISLSIFIKIIFFFREHLKQQIAVFYESVFQKIMDSGNASYYHKYAVLENLLKLLSNPKHCIELYVNFDSDLKERDLLRRIVHSIAKIAQGKAAKSEQQLSGPQEMQLRLRSLDILNTMIKSLLNFYVEQNNVGINKFLNIDDIKEHNEGNEDIEKLDDQSIMTDAFTIDLKERLEQSRKMKTDMAIACQKFNIKPKNGINYLRKVQIVTKENEAKDITNFLRTAQGLKKENMGDFLGENTELCLKVLDCYVNTYNFTNMHIVEAIRLFLSGFQLPGEGQKIDRIMQKLAEKYYRDNQQLFDTADCAYYLAFAIIMLQTDTHNPHVKKKMGLEGFASIVKGINGGKDLDSNYLSDIYQQILVKPISLSEFEEAREKLDLQKRNKNKEELFKQESQRLYQEGTQMLKLGQDKQYLIISDVENVGPLISSLWDIICAVFFLIIEDSEDLNLIMYCVDGMSGCIKLCGMLNLEIEKEALIKGFCKMTYLFQGREIKEKQLMCIKSIIHLAQNDGRYLKGCWKTILEIISKLDHYHTLVSGSKVEIEGFINEIKAKKKGLNAEREILIEKQNIEKIYKEISSDDYELIFSKSINLDQDSIYDFIKSLCEVSSEELSSKDNYRIFSLQKLVEVADYNMVRVRIVWSKLWNEISNHLTIVGSNSNPHIAEKAIDSLRQLATKFLQKDEISVYQFQKEFLKPFENIIMSNQSVYRTKEYVITCIANLVLLQAASIKSGWKIIFNIFQLAADDQSKDIVQKTFETLTLIFKNHFSQVKDNFIDLANTLKKFAKNYPKPCIEILFGCYKNIEDLNHIFALLSTLSVLITDMREEIRNYSCQTFFKLIDLLNSQFNQDYWQQIFKMILFHTIDELVTVQYESTLSIMTLGIVELFEKYYDRLEFMLKNFIEMLSNIIGSGLESVAQSAIIGIKQLIEKLGMKANSTFWESIILCLSNNLKKTKQTELLNLELNVIHNLKSNQSALYTYQNIVSNNIVFCIIQHNLIGLCEEVIDNYFNKIEYSSIFILTECLRESFELAYDFNCKFELRKMISIHFMKDLKQAAALFKQQKDGCSLYYKILNKIQDSEKDSKEIKVNNKSIILQYSLKIMNQFVERVNYSQEDDYLLSENERLMNCMVSVLCENIFPTLIKVSFEETEHLNEFTRLLLELVICNNIDVRIKVKEMLSITFSKLSNQPK